MEYKSHYSVLYRECLENLLSVDGHESGFKYIFDGTFGGGGHSLGLLEASENIFLLATDQDPEAFENGSKKLEIYKDRSRLYHTNFSEFPNLFPKDFPTEKLSGALLDLGVSSHHFDSPERGFSLRFDGPLDMRMASHNEKLETAAEIVNTYSEEDIADIIFQFGEERYSRRIAKEIIEQRNQEPINTTKQLENIVFHCYPKRERFGKTHPATRTFQALRIFVNKELEVLKSTIDRLVQLLCPGGRLCIISFHSLEDRIVKHEFKRLKAEGVGNVLTKKPILPQEDELRENPRSRSAKLRIFERK